MYARLFLLLLALFSLSANAQSIQESVAFAIIGEPKYAAGFSHFDYVNPRAPKGGTLTLAAIGSGGVYSTPGDMMRWMQQFLSSDFYTRSQQADRMQTLIYQRNQLTRVIGMDVPGRADALGLGWVYMKPKNGHPGIIQKTGGGGGFITYMAMNPQANVGAFVVVTRSPLTRFNNMSDGINDLVSELSGMQPNMQTASQ